MKNLPLYPALAQTIAQLPITAISTARKGSLQMLIDYIQTCVDADETILLHFICTHNSRRSQLSQIWAQAAAYYHGMAAHCFSGGVEVTAFNERAVAAVERAGFNVLCHPNRPNPCYLIGFAGDALPCVAYSKLYNDPANPQGNFAAVMTCSDADENCPYIPGTRARIPVRYDDPKAFDDTPLEAEKYTERLLQIGAEMWYVFSQIQKK